MKRILLLFALFALPPLAQAQRTASGEPNGPPLYTPKQIKEKFGVEITDGNYAPVIEAVIVWMNNSGQNENMPVDSVLTTLKETALRLPQPARGLMNFIIADFYAGYWQNNSWRIRSRTSAPDAGGGIATWDMKRLFEEAVKYYNLALEDPLALKAVPLKDYERILTYVRDRYNYGEQVGGQDKENLDKLSARFLPTLYDFVVFNTIKAYYGPLSLSYVRSFDVSDPRYLSDAHEFVKLEIPEPSEPAAEFQVLLLYRQLLEFRLQQFEQDKTSDNLLALIVTDVERLKYPKSRIGGDVTYKYMAALRRIMDKYDQYPEAEYATYELARALVERADGAGFYEQFPEELKSNYVDAYALCDRVADRWPEFAEYARSLQKSIAAPTLELSMAPDNPYPGDALLTLAKYKNIGELYIRIYALPENHEIDTDRIYESTRLNLHLNTKPVAEISGLRLPDYGDYRQYTAQFVMDGLPQGRYMLMASDKAFSDDPLQTTNHPVTLMTFQVSPLMIVTRDADRGSLELAEDRAASGGADASMGLKQAYVTDSRSGHAVQGAKIEVYALDYDSPQSPGGGYPLVLFGVYNTDAEGMAYISQKDNKLAVSKMVVTDASGGRLIEENRYSFYFTGGRSAVEREAKPEAVFFTDRAIYRPGQTVYYKILLLRRDFKTNNHALVTDRSVKVTFKDVNGKEIASQTAATNDFGSVHGSFVVPQGLLNGTMMLQTDYGTEYINIEEYKRPTFEVEFEPVDKTYRYGDRVEVTGKAVALAGYMIDNSVVKYRVTRLLDIRWPGWSIDPWTPTTTPISSGEVRTDGHGNFTIDFTAAADGLRDRSVAYHFQVAVDVTDITGETRSANMMVSVSDKPLVVQAGIPQSVNSRDSLYFDLQTTNLNGRAVAAEVNVTVEALKGPDRVLRGRMWIRPDTTLMSKGEFIKRFPYDVYSDEDDVRTYPVQKRVSEFRLATQADGGASRLALTSLKDQPSGWYRVTLKATDVSGIDAEQVYTMYLGGAPSGKKAFPIESMSQRVVAVKNSGEPGEQAVFMIAGPRKNSIMRYDVVHNDRIVESRTITVNEIPQKLTFPIREEHRGGFAVNFIMISDARAYTNVETVTVPFTNKMLDVEFTTFRGQLLPGQQERWTLTIKSKAGEREIAEMVATLYDASLDTFRPLTWPTVASFYPQRYYNAYSWQTNRWRSYLTSRPVNMYTAYQPKLFQLPDVRLNRFGGEYRYLMDGSRVPVMSRGGGAAVEQVFSDFSEVFAFTETVTGSGVIMGTSDIIALDSDTKVGNAGRLTGVLGFQAGGLPGAAPDEKYSTLFDIPGITSGAGAVQIATRSNFSETAFFYPQLRTNENGEIVIEFTVPESLTRWNMFGFAHTKDMKIGSVKNQLVTQKLVAMSANAPRFFREGDRIQFAAKVSNITADDLSGEAMLQLFDAATMQPLQGFMLSQGSSGFNAAAGQSAGLVWSLQIPEGVSAITYKLTARAGAHTDGEERTIPVLSNTILVTETMPFMVRAGQTRTVDFERLRSNAATVQRNQSLTLEFTSNPAWYAVQAMPYLMEYPYECTEQVFSKFYANSLAASVVNSSPAVKRVFEQWRDMPESKNALLSNLEKNQELKQVLLEETPWVVQAENESERKKRLGLLFDLNTMSGQQSALYGKLQQMQRGDGGFAWFDGLPADSYITQHVVAGFGQLARLNALDASYSGNQRMIDRALDYLDASLLLDYNTAKATKGFDPAKQHLSYTQLHYLYAASFAKHHPTDSLRREAFDFYYGQAKKYWKQFNIYGQGLAALAFHRYGDTALAREVVAALKASSSTTADMGMYWRANRNGYFWHEAAIETQALMIGVFDEVAGDTKSVEEMKIWLLRNKQTNDWSTTKATAEATYALLMTGGNLLDQSQTLDVKIGGKPLADATEDDIRPEAGTGYVKTVWSGGEVTTDKAHLEFTNPNTLGVAWGGLYWQYFQRMDKVTAGETDLRMEKRIFIKRDTPAGPELVPMEPGKLNVGDLLTVRLVLTAHRDYEYVHLKDMRASGLEPLKTVSGYRYQDGLWYYESVKDASTNFFISSLRSGVYVFEYDLRVTHAGDFSNGITTFQCMYAPEYSAHSEGVRIKVE